MKNNPILYNQSLKEWTMDINGRNGLGKMDNSEWTEWTRNR